MQQQTIKKSSITDTPSLNPQVELRQIDWRFLLPAPPGGAFQHLVLLGGTPRLVEQLLAVGFAQRISCEVLSESKADAVVILHNAHVSIKDVIAGLAPGGVLYWEVNRRVPGLMRAAPRRVAQFLQSMGLVNQASYAISPGFHRCEMYLPLEVPGALEWYVETLYQAATPQQRLSELLLRLSTGLNSHRFAPLAPFYAIIAVAPPAVNTMPAVLEHPGFAPELKQARLYPILLTDTGNRVTMLPFRCMDTEPIAVLKVPKLASFSDRTENEQIRLAAIRSQLDADFCRNLPEPRGILRYNEVTAGVESYVPGQSLRRSSGGWGIPLTQKLDDLRLAASWLGAFHEQTQIHHLAWGKAEIAQWVEKPTAIYKQRFGITTAEEQLFVRIIQYSGGLIGASFPTVWLHRDYNVWNLYRAGHNLNVIDWEGSRPGPALCDLLHFIIYWNETVRRLSQMEARLHGFYDLFIAPNFNDKITEAVYTAIRHYMQRLDMDHRFLPLLLAYNWIELALRRGEQQRDVGEVRADARAGNRIFPFITLLAEHATQLFGRHPDE